MLQRLDEKISVFYFYNSEKKISQPLYLKWQGKLRQVDKIGLHHTMYKGKTLVHVFSLIAGDLFFTLHYDTSTLCWSVVEISDGTPS